MVVSSSLNASSSLVCSLHHIFIIHNTRENTIDFMMARALSLEYDNYAIFYITFTLDVNHALYILRKTPN